MVGSHPPDRTDDAPEADQATEPGTAPVAGAAPDPGPVGVGVAGRPRWLVVVAAVLVLALAAAAVTFAVLWQRRSATSSAADAALATARSYAVTVTTYDYRTLDQNFADVLDGSTGSFKEQYGGASAALRQLINEARATASGTVLDAAVRSADTDRAEVLLFVDQSVTNAATPQPRIDRNRVRMTLEQRDDRWLISNLELT